MLRSIVIALLIAAAIGGWVISGLIGPWAKETAPSAIGPAASPAPASPKPATAVRGIRSTAQPLRREILVRGRTEVVRQVELKAETHGQVTVLPAAEGARVRKGDLLARLALDDRPARKAEAEALVRQRGIEYEAAMRLEEKGYRSKTAAAAAAAALDAARAAVVRMETEIGQTAITAPFDGVVESRYVEIGAFLQAGDPILVLVDENPFLVVAHVSERDVAKVEVGSPARARLITGDEVVGTVSYIATIANSETRTFRVEIETPNKGRRLRAGVTAEIWIPVETVAAHRISPALLTLNDAGVLGVRAVDEAGRVVFHRAEIADDGTDGVWLTGLPDTLTVISVGQEFVREGERVELVLDGKAQGS